MAMWSNFYILEKDIMTVEEIKDIALDILPPFINAQAIKKGYLEYELSIEAKVYKITALKNKADKWIISKIVDFNGKTLYP